MMVSHIHIGNISRIVLQKKNMSYLCQDKIVEDIEIELNDDNEDENNEDVSESDKDDDSSYDVAEEEKEEKDGDLEYLEKRHMLLRRIKEEKPMVNTIITYFL